MNPLQEFHRLRKFLFCLAGESHDDVRGQGRMGEFFPEKFAALCVFFRGIATVHPLQGGVAAALQGQVEMRTDLRKPGKLQGGLQLVPCRITLTKCIPL